MRSTILVLTACGAVSLASECQSADETTLLQGRSLVRHSAKAKKNTDAQVLLESLRGVANSLVEGSVSTISGEEVDEALQAAREALAELSPAIHQQVVMAQQQLNHASAAVEACHESAGVRSGLQQQVDTRAAAVEQCQAELAAAAEEEREACERAQDCLCDEARERHTGKEALCESVTETYEVAYCEHHVVCDLQHQCHASELEVYDALRADIEAEIATLQQEYMAVEQSACLTRLIQIAMTPPITPIPHADMLACSNVDVSGIAVQEPQLPDAPAACPAASHGDPECGGGPEPPDCRLSAYWEYDSCGCGGNDQNHNWCGGLGSGHCPDTVTTNICPSGTAYLAEWHPKPYPGTAHRGRGTPGHLVRDGCEYIWHAQYACEEPQFDCALSAYWEYGSGGCGGNDQNWHWCDTMRGNCPETVQTNLCPSGTAHLAVFHPKPYDNPHHHQHHPDHYWRDNVEYIWHAQYAC